MNKPLLALAGIALLGTAGVASVLLASSDGDDAAVSRAERATPPGGDAKGPGTVATVGTCDPSATPPPGTQLWRWMDLVVILPKEGFGARPGYIPPEPTRPNGGEGLVTYKFDPSDPSNPNVVASVLIDAATGATIHTGAPEHGKVMGIALCPLDPATAPWPYNGDPPRASTTQAPTIQPDPGSGMYVSFTTGDGGYSGEAPTPADCDRVGEAIAVHNWRSSAFIGQDSRTGSICKGLSMVQTEDLVAFQRFLDRVELCVYQNAEC